MGTRLPRSVVSDEELRRLYDNEKLTIAEIADLYRETYDVVRRRFIMAGIARRTREQIYELSDSRKLPHSKVSAKKLKELYVDNGLTAAEIGAVYGVTHDIVIYRLRMDGIPVRDRVDAGKLSGSIHKKLGSTNATLKTEMECRNCNVRWKYDGNTRYTHCPKCGRRKFAVDIAEEYGYSRRPENLNKLKQWASTLSKEQKAASAKKRRLLRRVLAMQKICNSTEARCMRCGCNDFRLLEINHKNGGGGQESKSGFKGPSLINSVLKNEYPVDTLEVLCRPCNAIHYLELKYGPLPIKVVWAGEAL